MRRVWLGGVSLIVAGALLSLYSWMQAPSSSPGSTNTTKPVDSVLGQSTSLTKWQTTYFTTQLPTNYRIRTVSESASTGTYMISSTAQELTDQIGIITAPLGSSSLNEVSGVRLRQAEPSVYQPTTLAYAPNGAYVFNRTDNTELDIFWQSQGRYVSVAASGTPNRSGALSQALAAIVTNWQWN